jgi:hypothetical protein
LLILNNVLIATSFYYSGYWPIKTPWGYSTIAVARYLKDKIKGNCPGSSLLDIIGEGLFHH